MTRRVSACAFLLLLPLGGLAGALDRGIDSLDKKNFDLAISCFDAHLREHPGDAAAYLKRGLANYYGKEDCDKAIKDFSSSNSTTRRRSSTIPRKNPLATTSPAPSAERLRVSGAA